MNSCTEKEDLVREFYQALDNNDRETIMKILAPEVVIYNPGPQKREENLRGLAGWHAVFSGNRLEILDQVCEGPVVATRVDMHADHTEGEFEGVAATGRHIIIPAISFERFRENRIVERRIVSERAGKRRELGLPAATEEGGQTAHEEQANKKLVVHFYAAFAANDQPVLEKLMAPDFVIHVPRFPEPVDRDTHLWGIGQFTAAFGNLQMRFHDQIARGDLVASRITWSGTHSGTFQNQPPTGKTVQVRAFALERFANGRIVERWFYQDIQALQQQLGIDFPAAE